MHDKKRILYIHHGGGLGGAEKSLVYLIKNLNHDLYEFHVFCLLWSKALDNFRSVGAIIHYDRKLRNYMYHSEANWIDFRKKWHVVKICRMLFEGVYTTLILCPRLIRAIKPDIIHLNSLFLFNWLIGVKLSCKVPVILHVREPLGRGYLGVRKKIIQKIVCRFADRIIAISQDNADRIACASKTQVIYNPFFSNEVTSDISKSYRGCPFTILYVGGDNPIKGFATMVKAIPLINQTIKVIMAGSYDNITSEERYLLSTFNVRIIGYVANIETYIRQATVLVAPSKYPHFLRPVVEAMQLGIPSIASNVEGMDEIIIDGKTGILVPEGDPFTLADRINWASENPYRVQELGANAKSLFENEFSLEANIAKIEKLYTTLLEKCRG